MQSYIIDKEFLENNLFEEAKIGAGSFPWHYEVPKKYRVTIDQWNEHGVGVLYIINHETHQELKFSAEPKLTKEDLHRCILFMGVPDEFDYE